MEKQILQRLSALSHPARLSIFRLLVRRYPDQLAAGEIATELALKPSTLSAYLSALTDCGLLIQKRTGTSLRYAIDMAELRETFGYLLTDCCNGRIDLCAPALPQRPFPLSQDTRDMSDPVYDVLFICTGNSARSIFAETLLREIGGDRFRVFSAGTKPYSELNPFAVEVLEHKGHDVSDLRSKNVSEFQQPDAPSFDFVFTVCNRAANEECPPWPGQPISAHWGIPDPVKATGTDAERSLAFHEAYGALRNRITAFAALPLASLDRISLQTAVDNISRIDEGAPA